MRSKSVVSEARDILLAIEWIQLGARRSVPGVTRAWTRVPFFGSLCRLSSRAGKTQKARGGTHRAGPVATAGAAA